MFTRFMLFIVLADALYTFSLSRTFALSESQQDAAIASLQSSLSSLQSKVTTLQNTVNTQATTIASQQTQISTLKGLTSSFSKKTDTTRTDGKKGTELYITGLNLHVVNGLGATNGDPNNTGMTQVNGLGNVIIGYDNLRAFQGGTDTRTGSHNLVLGDYNDYSSYGGVVAGFINSISGLYASVSGGNSNTSSGTYSSISGGASNIASGAGTSGVYNNKASATVSCVSGGYNGTASGDNFSVTGGAGNTASGNASNVSGGNGRTALGDNEWVAGSLYQVN